MDINTICICGAGTMGCGIAQVSAMAGFHTIIYEVNKEVLENAKKIIGAGLQMLIEKNKITLQKKQETFARILFTNDLQLCLADVFIEAIVERADSKIALFNQLAELNHSETIFASNTSSLSISSIAEKVNNPQRVAGLHFFNPAPVMKLVEVVKGKQTDEVVIKRLILLTKQMGKVPVVCKDAPGFIVNRVARPFYIESLRLAEEGLSNFEVIDSLLESRGYKLGPFKLMDLIGNDINYTVSCSVYDRLGQPERLRPSSIQKEKLDKGELGRKTIITNFILK